MTFASSSRCRSARKSERLYLAVIGSSRVRQRRKRDEGARNPHVRTQKQRCHCRDPDRRSGPARQLIRYQFGNQLGSAVLELDDHAEVISHGNLPYGHILPGGASQQTPKRYRCTNKERDEENDLSYHSARYYVLWLGRWLNPDLGIKMIWIFMLIRIIIPSVYRPSGWECNELIPRPVRGGASPPVTTGTVLPRAKLRVADHQMIRRRGSHRQERDLPPRSPRILSMQLVTRRGRIKRVAEWWRQSSAPKVIRLSVAIRSDPRSAEHLGWSGVNIHNCASTYRDLAESFGSEIERPFCLVPELL